MKLAFIVQRYGREILGGSETLARQLAERLSRRHEITVLTTTAKDYITWKNEYEPGEEKQRGVQLIRFAVDGERDIDEFNKFSEEIYQGEPTREQELDWLNRQGPVCPGLIEYLEKEHENFDLLVFFTYLYYPTFYGLQVAPEKSVLIPTAHDEPPLKLSIFKEMFQLPGSFLFNTEAEELLVLERFPVHKKMRETIGMGMELLDQPDPSIFRSRHNASAKYFLYAGRIDGGKGLEELFRYFTFYKEENPASGNLELMLIGKLGMKLPDDKSIRYAGFVDEAEKLSAMAGAIAVLQPSKMESLSIVTLEAFAVGTPVVANAASRVLIDHCRKANAGFYYHEFEEFEGIINLLLSDRNLGKSLGKNGQRYIKDNYGWQKLLNKYELALRASGRPLKEPKEARRRDPGESRAETTQKGRERDDQRPPAEIVAATPAASQSDEKPEPERSERPERGRSVKSDAAQGGQRDAAPHESPDSAGAFVGAVSESADTDATVSEMEQRKAPSRDDVDASREGSGLPAEARVTREGDLAEPAKAESVVDSGDEPRSVEAAPLEPAEPAEPATDKPSGEVITGVEPEGDAAAELVEEEVSEDVAHLPSFFQAAIPARKQEPVVRIAPKPAEPKLQPPPPPPPPEPPADGGLPSFFRPKPEALAKPAPQPEELKADEPEAVKPEAEEPQIEATKEQENEPPSDRADE